MATALGVPAGIEVSFGWCWDESSNSSYHRGETSILLDHGSGYLLSFMPMPGPGPCRAGPDDGCGRACVVLSRCTGRNGGGPAAWTSHTDTPVHTARTRGRPGAPRPAQTAPAQTCHGGEGVTRRTLATGARPCSPDPACQPTPNARSRTPAVSRRAIDGLTHGYKRPLARSAPVRCSVEQLGPDPGPASRAQGAGGRPPPAAVPPHPTAAPASRWGTHGLPSAHPAPLTYTPARATELCILRRPHRLAQHYTIAAGVHIAP